MKALLLIASLCFLSCEKMDKTCYDCELRSISGYTEKRKYCSEDGSIPQFKDRDGNDMNAHCTAR